MVFLDESHSFWPFPLRRSLSNERKLKRSDSGSDGEEARCWDIADAVEQGLAREFTADYTAPLARINGLHRFRVVRSDDKRQYRLYRDSGEFLMYASVSKDCERVDVFTYDPQTSDSVLYDPDRPAFTMSFASSRSEWRLSQERCDRCRHSPVSSCGCRGRRDVMQAQLSSREVGEGTNHRMTLSAASCPQGRCDDDSAHRLATKAPRWDAKIECMVLSFKQRKVLASAKNFVLTPESDPQQVVCQHGKIAPDTFALDVRHPMTIIQAFGASLSTIDWQ